MSDDEPDGMDRQQESIRLEIGTVVTDSMTDGKEGWVTVRQVGKGAFGSVYHVIGVKSGLEAALKVEQYSAGDNLLKIEKEIFVALRKTQNHDVMQLFDEGAYDRYRFIVMTLCGLDLEKIAEQMNYKFRQDTILRVGIRTLLAVKILHEHLYIHRDLKPCNFAVDYQPGNPRIYLFDFGMARKYVKQESDKWFFRKARENVQFRGTVRYCSLTMHARKDLGRVDDVWSWFFMMTEMQSQLPWASNVHHEKVEVQKTDLLLDYMNKDPFLRSLLPVMDMIKGLKYEDRPDYSKIFEFLYAKLKEINGKLTGPIEYDAVRTSKNVTEQVIATMKTMSIPSAPKVSPVVEDEETCLRKLRESFRAVVVPSGEGKVLKDLVDFFEPQKPQKVEPVIKSDRQKNKSDRQKNKSDRQKSARQTKSGRQKKPKKESKIVRGNHSKLAKNESAMKAGQKQKKLSRRATPGFIPKKGPE